LEEEKREMRDGERERQRERNKGAGKRRKQLTNGLVLTKNVLLPEHLLA